LVNLKLVGTLVIVGAFLYVLLATDIGKTAREELKKLGSDTKSFTQKAVDKIDKDKKETK